MSAESCNEINEAAGGLQAVQNRPPSLPAGSDPGGGESPIINELAVLEAKTIDLGDLTIGQQ